MYLINDTYKSFAFVLRSFYVLWVIENYVYIEKNNCKITDFMIKYTHVIYSLFTESRRIKI